jgi:membrane-bound lytic murein transglycosylase B
VHSLRRFVFFLAALALVAGAAAAPPAHKAKQASSGYDKRPDVRAFVDEMVAQHHFKRRELLGWMAQARYQPKIVEAMQRPYLEPPKWYDYLPRFLTPQRVDGGVEFARRNAAALARAEQQFGVRPEIIVAIIGVETLYGKNVGSHRVIDALTTLAFDYPRRASFFRGELKEFLIFAREQNISPLEPKGSFAGAIGVPQFMPGSVRRFAIDFDGDGHIDLWGSEEDAIGSVANYLARHDWLRGQPVLLPAALTDEARDNVLRKLDGGLSERRPLAAWNLDGVAALGVPDDMSSDPVGLLQLDEGATGEASYWIACPNFYVITRYNKSSLYAAAVWRLSEMVRVTGAASR